MSCSARLTVIHCLVITFLTLLAIAAIATPGLATPASLDNLLPEAQFPNCIGINTHILPDASGEYRMFSDTGVKLARTDLIWSEVEKVKGKYDFTLADSLVKRYTKSKIRTLLIITGDNRLYGGEGATSLPKTLTIAGFAAFATAAAKHFKGKTVIYELSNEPDGNVEPAGYVKWARTTAQALRQGDPSAAIVGPGAHSWALPWLEDVFKLGLLDIVDGLSVHLYLGGDSDKPQPMPEMQEKEGRIKLLKDLVAKYTKGGSVPMMNSEWGYCRINSENPPNQQVTTENQARYLARAYLLSAYWGFRANVWYCWFLYPSSEAVAGEYGLVSGSRMPMPAYFALRNLAKQLPKGKYVSRHEIGTPDDWCLEFDTSKGRVLAVWTCAPVEYENGHDEGHVVSISVGDSTKVHVTDLLGNSYYDLKPSSGKITLRVTGAVQYLRLTTQ